jgi:kinesin family protein 2/24
MTRYIEEHRFILDNCFGGECNNLDIYNCQIKP